jgi:hypothetical protein
MTPDERLEAAFWQFHRENPVIYKLLSQYAHQALNAGRGRWGIGMIWERMRWYVAVETRDPSGLKLNNNYRSRYARLLMRQEPELEGIFETRRLNGHSVLEP